MNTWGPEFPLGCEVAFVDDYWSRTYVKGIVELGGSSTATTFGHRYVPVRILEFTPSAPDHLVESGVHAGFNPEVLKRIDQENPEPETIEI